MSLGWSIVVVKEALDEVEFTIVEVVAVAAAVQVFMRWWVGGEEVEKYIIFCHVAFLL